MFDHHKSFGADEARPSFEIIFLEDLVFKPGPEKVLKQRVNIRHSVS